MIRSTLRAADCVTVAVRRERLYDRTGQNILDFIDLDRYTLLPNTAGCYTAADAIRAAKLGREILRTLGNPGADWVKLEVLGDSKTLLPDPVETVAACRELGPGWILGPLLHQRLSRHGPAIESGRCGQRDARR